MVTLLASAVGLLMPWPVSFLVDSVLGQRPVPRFVTRVFHLAPDNRLGMMYFAVFALLENGCAERIVP